MDHEPRLIQPCFEGTAVCHFKSISLFSGYHLLHRTVAISDECACLSTDILHPCDSMYVSLNALLLQSIGSVSSVVPQQTLLQNVSRPII